jgi:hypothetical protein
MPNWCECDLEVYGKKKDLQKFKSFVETKTQCLDQNTILPYPKKYADMDADSKEPYISKGFNAGGYGWCVENWGTKWGIVDPELVDESDDSLSYGFRCAWSPCVPVIKAWG